MKTEEGNSSMSTVVAIVGILAVALIAYLSIQMIRGEAAEDSENDTAPGATIELNGGASMSDSFMQ